MSNPNVFTEDVTINKRLFVTGNAIVTGDSRMLGHVVLAKDLTTNVSGRSFFNGNVIAYKNLTVSGTLQSPSISVEGAIIGANLTVDAISTNVITANDISTNGLLVQKDATLRSRTFVNGQAQFTKNVVIDGSLSVLGDVLMNYLPNTVPRNAIIDGNIFNDDLNANNRLFVTKTAEFRNNIVVNFDASFNRAINVGGNVTIANRLNVKDISISGNLAFNNFSNSSIPSSAIVGGALPANTLVNDVSLNQRLFVTGDIIARNALNVTNDASFNQKLRVGAAVTLGSTLAVTGATTFANNVTILGNLDANFANSSIPSIAIDGGALPANRFTTDVSLNRRLFVTGDITASNNLFLAKDASFNQKLNVIGAVILGNTLAVTGAASFANNVTILGNLDANFANSSIPSIAIEGGALPANRFTTDVSLNQRLFVIGDIVARDELHVTNDASFNQKLRVGAAVTMGSTLAVTGVATFANNVTVSGNLNANFANSSIPSSAIAGGVMPVNRFTTDVSLNQRLFVTGDIVARDELHVTNDASFNQKLRVGAAVTMGSTLAVTGAATFASNVTVTGNLNARFADGSIASSAIAGGVMPVNRFATDVSLNQRLFVTDDIIANDNLFVIRDASFNQNLNVVGAVTLGNTLAVTGTAAFANEVSMNQRLFVTGDIVARDELHVTNDASFNQKLRVGAAVTMGSTLAVTGVATFANNVTVSGNLNANFANSSIPSSAIAGGVMPVNRFATDVSLNQRLFVTDDITANDNLFVIRDASFNQKLNVVGAATLGSTLAVTGAATFANNVTVTGNLNARFADGSIASSAIVGGVMPLNRFATDVSLSQRLFVTDDITANDTLYVARDASFNQTLRVVGAVTLGNILTVTGATTFADNVAILGNLNANFANSSIPSSAIVGGAMPANRFATDVSLNQRLFVTGDIIARDELYVARDASFNQTLRVVGAVTLGNTLVVTGAAAFADDVTVTGNLIAQYADGMIPSSAIAGGVMPADKFATDVSLNRRLFVTGNIIANNNLFLAKDASFNQKLNVVGAVTLGNSLAVTGAATFANNVTILGDLDANFANASIPSSAILGGALPANTLANDVSFQKRIFVAGDASFNKILVGNDATFNKNIIVNENILAQNRLIVPGLALLNDISANKLNVINDSSFNGNVYINKDLIVRGRLNVQEYTSSSILHTTTVNYATIVTEDLSVNGNLRIEGDSILNTLTVTNNATFDKIFATEDMQMQKRIFVIGDASIGGILTARFNDGTIPSSKIIGGVLPANAFNNDITLAKRMFVTGDASFNGKLTAKFDSDFKQKLTVAGNVQAGANLSVIGDADIDGILTANFNDGAIPSSKILGGALPANTLNNDVILAKRIFVTGDASFNGKLTSRYDSDFKQIVFVGGDIRAQSRLFVVGDASIGGILTARFNDSTIPSSKIIGGALPTSTLTNNVTFEKSMFIIEDLSINGKLSTRYDSVFNQKLNVGGNLQAGANITVIGDASIGGILTARFNDSTIPSSKIIGGALPTSTLTNDVTFSKRMFINEDISLNGRISARYDATFNQKVTVGGNLQAGTNLTVGGNTNINGNVVINGSLTARTYARNSIPQAAIIGLLAGNQSAANLIFDTDISMEQRLSVGGDISTNGLLYVYGTGTSFVKNHLTVDGIFNARTYVDNSIPMSAVYGLDAFIFNAGRNIPNFSEDLSMNKRLFVFGDLSTGGALAVTDSATIGNTLIVQQATTLNNALTVAGDTNLATTLAVTGKTVLSSDVSMNANVDISGNVGIMNNLNVKGNITMTGGSMDTPIFNQFVTMFNNAAGINLGGVDTNTIIGKRLYVTNATTLASTLAVTGKTTLRGDVSMNTNLDVSGNVGILKDLNVRGNITMNGGYMNTTDLGESVTIFDTASIITVGGADTSTIIGKTLAVTNKTILRGDVSMNTNVDVSGNVGIMSNLNVKGNITMNGGSLNTTDLAETVTIFDTASIINLGGVATATNIGNTLAVTGKTILRGDVSMNANVDVSGNVGILNNLNVKGNITMNGGSLNTTDLTETVTLFDTASIINLGGASTNINIGTGSGTSTTVTIGASSDTVNILGNLNITGTTTTISATNLDISDNAITLNKGGPTATFIGAGINIEDTGDLSAGYIRVDSDKARFVVKLPSLANGNPQYIATKDNANDLSANNFTTNGNITMAGSGSILMTGKYIKQF